MVCALSCLRLSSFHNATTTVGGRNMPTLHARFCAAVFLSALCLTFCTRAEEGGGGGGMAGGHRGDRPGAQDWARRVLNKADEIGLTPDQKSKIEAIANAKPD